MDAAGLTRGIGQAITDIWNKSMLVSPIGKIFLNQGKKSAPGIGSTVMEITQRVIKEQEEIKRQEKQERKEIELSAGITDYFDQANMTKEQLEIFEEASNRPNDSHYLYTEATVNFSTGKRFSNFDDAALDALKDQQTDITKYGLSSNTRDIVSMMSFAEAYNGKGYYNNGYDNPYLYSGTNQYTSGKYIEIPNGSGGTKSVYDPNVVDEQVGVYLLLDSILNR